MPFARVLICFAVGTLAPAAGLASERLAAEYVVSWQGLEVARFETRIEVDEVAYRVGYAARTVGVVGWLFPFTSAGASEGAIADPGLAPARYVGEARRRDGPSSWTVRFAPDGTARDVEVRVPEDEQREPVPPALRRAPDPLSLALRATGAAAPGARVEDVTFDGKRAVRFALDCAEEQHSAAEESFLIEIETVLRCTLDGEMEGGRSRRWASGRDDERRPATVLLSPDIVPGRYWPVRVTAETRFGEVVAELTDVR